MQFPHLHSTQQMQQINMNNGLTNQNKSKDNISHSQVSASSKTNGIPPLNPQLAQSMIAGSQVSKANYQTIQNAKVPQTIQKGQNISQFGKNSQIAPAGQTGQKPQGSQISHLSQKVPQGAIQNQNPLSQVAQGSEPIKNTQGIQGTQGVQNAQGQNVQNPQNVQNSQNAQKSHLLKLLQNALLAYLPLNPGIPILTLQS